MPNTPHRLLSRGLIAALFLSLAACKSSDIRPTEPPAASPEPAAEPLAKVVSDTQVAAPVIQDQLTADMVYETLAGELGLQRQHNDIAHRHLYEAARLARDTISAERSMKVALMAGDHAAASRAGQLWLEIAPHDLDALQLNTVLALRLNDEARALDYLKIIVNTGDEQERDGFVDAMTATLQDKNYPQAERVMGQLSDAWPGRADGPYALGLLAMIREEYGMAQRELQRALEYQPQMPRAVAMLARVHLARDEQDQALQVLAEGIQANPRDAMLRSSYGRMLVDAGQIEEAYRQYQTLIDISPDDHETRFVVGILALQLKKIDAAKGWFEGLYESGNKADRSAYYLGWIAEQDDQPQKALKWYRKVKGGDSRIDAGQRIAHLTAAQNLNAAREILQHLRPIAKDEEQEIGIYLVELDLLGTHATREETYRLYDSALAEFPANIELLYSRAMYAIRQDQLDILERDLRQVLTIDPQHADSLNALGYTLTDRTDRHAEAFEYISQALALKPDSPAVLDSMGWVHYRLGELEEALKYLRRAFDSSQDGEIAAHLGEVLWMHGDQQQAREVWDKGKEYDPHSEYLHKTMQRLLP